MTRLAFIGGGNMARSLIGGLLARGWRPRQIVVADPMPAQLDALKADPGNREAAFRLGDALLRSGDKARGCKYLQRAGKLAAARERAAAAGCGR